MRTYSHGWLASVLDLDLPTEAASGRHIGALGLLLVERLKLRAMNNLQSEIVDLFYEYPFIYLSVSFFSKAASHFSHHRTSTPGCQSTLPESNWHEVLDFREPFDRSGYSQRLREPLLAYHLVHIFCYGNKNQGYRDPVQ
jgi:hypothetical protein